MRKIITLLLILVSLDSNCQTKGFYYNISIGAMSQTYIGSMISLPIGYSIGKHSISNLFEYSNLLNFRKKFSERSTQTYYSLFNINYTFNQKVASNSYVYTSLAFSPFNYFAIRTKNFNALNNTNIWTFGLGYKHRLNGKLYFTTQCRIHYLNTSFIYRDKTPDGSKYINPISFLVGVGK